MSGEVVVAPALPFSLIGVAFLGVGAGAVGVARLVKSIVDGRVEVARQEIERKKTCLEAWQKYQAEQQQHMISLQKTQQAITASEQRLSAIRLTEGYADHRGEGPSAIGYTSPHRGKDSEHAVRSLLNSISQILQDLPIDFRESANSPYLRLVNQQKRLTQKLDSREKPRLEEATSFRDTIHRTLQSYMSSLEMMSARQQELTQQIEFLLNDVLTYRHLASESKQVSELDGLENHLLSLVSSQHIQTGQLELLEKKFKEIQTEITLGMANSAFRSSLAAALTQHLADMGYTLLESFPQEADQPVLQATMRIPGGERVRVAIQPTNKIAFQVCHEAGKEEGQMSKQELSFFRQQEQKWCQDLQELIRRLTKEGYAYNIALERSVPEASIPVVVVETVDEILSSEEGWEEEEDIEMGRFAQEPMKRKLT